MLSARFDLIQIGMCPHQPKYADGWIAHIHAAVCEECSNPFNYRLHNGRLSMPIQGRREPLSKGIVPFARSLKGKPGLLQSPVYPLLRGFR